MMVWVLLFAVILTLGVADAAVSSYPEAVGLVRSHIEGKNLKRARILLQLAAALENLRQGANIDVRDSTGYTPLMLAVQAGEYDTVNLLLQNGANAKLLAPNRVTLLMLAARSGSYALFHRIQGLSTVSLQVTDSLGRTLFLHACSGGNILICNDILKNGGVAHARDTRGYSCLIYAAQSGNSSLFYELLNRGSNPRLVTGDGYDLLMAAAQGGSPELVEAALSIGYSPLAADTRGCTALMEAARYNAVPAVDILLRSGADPHARDRHGATAAMLAAAVGNAAVFYKLGGYACMSPDHGGRTALVYAAAGGDVQLVHDLLLHGESTSVLEGLPLRTAIYYGHTRAALEIASFQTDITREELHSIPIHSWEDAIYFASFLSERCNVPADSTRAKTLAHQLCRIRENPHLMSAHDSSPYGYTPLQNTIMINFSGLFAFLLEQGADVNATDRYGKTPLMTAVENGNFEALKILLAKGADVNVLDSEGYSALMLAALNGWAAAFNLLLENGANPNMGISGGPTIESCAEAAGQDGEDILRGLTGDARLPTNQAEAYYALCQAMHTNNRVLFERILEAWPDVEACDEQGCTLLMFAARDSCRAEFLKILIEHGADVNAADAHNRQPLQYVKTPEKRNILLQSGAIP